MHSALRWNVWNYRCGKIGKLAVYISMFMGMIGACGSYILFISGVLEQWISPLFGVGSSLSFYLSITILVPFPIALSMLRSYSLLSSTAKFGVAGVVLALSVTAGDGILHLNEFGISRENIVDFDTVERSQHFVVHLTI